MEEERDGLAGLHNLVVVPVLSISNVNHSIVNSSYVLNSLIHPWKYFNDNEI